MFKNEKNKILACFFQAVFFSRKKKVFFFSEKNKLVFFSLQPYTSQSLYRHTYRGAKSIAIIGTQDSSHNTRSDSQAHRQSNQHHIHT